MLVKLMIFSVVLLSLFGLFKYIFETKSKEPKRHFLQDLEEEEKKTTVSKSKPKTNSKNGTNLS